MQSHIDECCACFDLLRDLIVCATLPSSADKSAATPTTAWQPPRRFDEFEIVCTLGRGAMGLVYKARDLNLDREVAVKFIASATPSDQLHRRFLREARALARLSHPAVVTAYRRGEVDGRPYLVSELVHGRSLDQVQKPLPWPQALRIATGLARGLAAAHRSGILHRDIKPANVMLTDSGEIKLLDFGLAKEFHSAAASTDSTGLSAIQIPGEEQKAPGGAGVITEVGVRLGTPLYMSPELWHGEQGSLRTDVYSVGAVMYELLVGCPPHRGRGRRELRRAIEQEVQPVATLRPEIDRGFAAVVDCCLRHDPAARYPSAVELCAALEALAPGPGRPRTSLRPGLGLGVALGLGAVVGLGALFSAQGYRQETFRFAAPTTYSAGVLSERPTGCALDDLNGDGKLDVVVAKLETNNRRGGALAVLLGNGDGTLQPALETEVAAHARPVVVADLDGDGKRDLATVGSIAQRLDLLRGHGDGTFQPLRTIPLSGSPPPYPEGLVAAPLTPNGDLGLLVAQPLGRSMAVWVGDRSGTYREAPGGPIAVDGTPRAIAAADLDNDGHTDAVTANEEGTVSVLLGRGDGTFAPARTTAVGRQLGALAVAALDPRKITLDLVVVDRQQGAVLVLANRGGGRFEVAHRYPVGGAPLGLAAGDLNGDGSADLAVASQRDNLLSLLAGRGDGSFGAAQTIALPPLPECVAMGDLNGDGKRDIVVTQNGVNLVTVLLNDQR